MPDGVVNVRAGVMPGRIEDYNGLPVGSTIANLLNRLTENVRAREPNFDPSQFELRQDNVVVEPNAALRDGALILLTKKVKGNEWFKAIRRVSVRVFKHIFVS